jgi:hypothetical protein
LNGIRELLGVEIAAERLAADLARTFAEATGWHLTPAAWSTALLARRAAIATDRYGNPAWTERR